MGGLMLYMAMREVNFDHYIPHWVRWAQQHYPGWTIVDMDSRSDLSFLSYVQKARAENERTLLLLDSEGEEGNPPGITLPLLQQLVREQARQTFVVLFGRHRVVEKMGAALPHFYQISSEEEMKNILISILRKE